MRSVLQPMVAGLGDLEPVALRAGDEVELDDVVERLAAAAYTRVDLVEQRGEFAVRGGILDVFPPTEEHPLRVELWGDTVEEVRCFRVADQRSLEIAEHGLWAPPCRELLLTDRGARAGRRSWPSTHPGLVDVLGKLAEGIAVEGMESLAPVLVDDMELLLDQLPAGTHVVVRDPERIRTRAHDLFATSQEFLEASWANAAAGARRRSTSAPRPTAAWPTSARGAGELGDAVVVGQPVRRADEVAGRRAETSVVAARGVEGYRGDTARALADIKGWLGDGWRVVLVTEGHGSAERLVEVLGGEDIPARLDRVAGRGTRRRHSCTSRAPASTAASSARRCGLAVLTETDLMGQAGPSTKGMRRMPSRRRNMVDPLQLRPATSSCTSSTASAATSRWCSARCSGATREYLVIEYAAGKRGQPGDRLFVPTDQLDQVTRYVGGEQPSLAPARRRRLAEAKGRARKAVKEIAAELIRLYSARTSRPGTRSARTRRGSASSRTPSPTSRRPTSSGPSTRSRRDMEKTVPMDRIICGDVGYGKTEIAVRAAFKAVQDGKQVAVLVPTTLLVNQHLSTFAERYASFPVKVAALSRFQTDKEANEVKAGLPDGTVDVVIGTHRILSAEVKFKDLGLVIVDEEQRFGVEHKEQLKHLRTNVDVLTMSATPIPRTLEMAVTGIREMSTILTPPEERHPVLTFVGPYDEKQIAAAIRRELLREGQVFYIHNRVESIDRAAARLRELVPEARIATAHGQMGEHALEQVVLDFWEKRFDVLVCTTIVESGLDISNANTLILERADVMGLSQLHQLRGRVGRGRERAYAYFLYPPEKPLTETAHDRLATIAAHSDLGAGMWVAMKDLEIRGAGNLLGGEQSGHIAAVGFDLYVRLVGEAVADFKGEGSHELAGRQGRAAGRRPPAARLHPRRAAAAGGLPQAGGRRVRGGPRGGAGRAATTGTASRPTPVTNLLEVARFRLLARRAGLTEVALAGNNIRFAPVELPESAAAAPPAALPGHAGQARRSVPSWCRSPRPPGWVGSRCATSSSCTGAATSSRPC